MIEVVILSNRPFGSKQAITGFKDLPKKIVREFFSQEQELVKCCWLPLSFLLAESSESNETWHISMAKYVCEKLSRSCACYFIITWLQFFYKDSFYTGILFWVFFLDIQWRGQWREIMNYTKLEEQRKIFSSNIGDYRCHQITDVKYCHSIKYSRYNL